jgi:hypothetical protein
MVYSTEVGVYISGLDCLCGMPISSTIDSHFFTFFAGCVYIRTPQSLMAGLMWIVVKDGSNHLRHVCRQEDALSAYGWTKHNGRDYGHQVLVDHGMILTTKFIKSKGESSGYGGDWAVRIDAQIDK